MAMAMLDRRTLLGCVGFVGLAAGLRWFNTTDVQAAGAFDVQKSDSEWRRLLSKAQYEVLRLHHTESPGSEPAQRREAKGRIFLCGLRARLVLLADEVRKPHWLAELLETAAERGRDCYGLCAAVSAHGGALPALRRPSRSSFRRRSAADGAALLHEWRRADVHGKRGRRGLMLARPSSWRQKRSDPARQKVPGRVHLCPVPERRVPFKRLTSLGKILARGLR